MGLWAENPALWPEVGWLGKGDRLPGGSWMVPEELGETGPFPGPEAQVKNRECLLKAMRNHYRILEQMRGISSQKRLSCPAENTDFGACASQMPLIFFHLCGLRNICVSPPHCQTLCSCPRPSSSVPLATLVRSLSSFRTNPWTAGLKETFPKCSLCAIKTPAWKILAASISLPEAATPNCFAARSCVTKGIPPANVPVKHTGGPGLPARGAVTSRQCVSFLWVT